MQQVYILYRQYFDNEGKNLKIGGVETYIYNLSAMLKRNGFHVVICQCAKQPFHHRLDFADVVGVVSHAKNGNDADFASLVQYAETNGNPKEDILIFGADICIQKTCYQNVIAIQHGIGWDVQPTNPTALGKVRYTLRSLAYTFKKAQLYRFCRYVVCVDYNFLNWYRTLLPTGVEKLKVIPNFTQIPTKTPKTQDKSVSVIFSRRFQEFRGTRIFAQAIENLLLDGYALDVTVAGEGPDAQWLHEKLDRYPQVRFTKYHPSESISVHQNFDIAVVPSLGSEGTSLSLLEAMAANCAVISTNIGGLTNIIIDGYNGLMIEPDARSLEEALRILVADEDIRRRISDNGYETVRSAFSLAEWERKWMNVISAL